MSEELKNLQRTSDIKKKLNEIIQSDAIEDFLKTDEFKFDYKDIDYRMKKPTYKMKQEAYKERIIKYSRLLKEKNEDGSFTYSVEEDLIKAYKERNIDIPQMNRRLDKLCNDKEKLMMKLGEGLSKKASVPELDLYRKEIEKILLEIQDISLKKTGLLEFSIENQVLLYFYAYLTYLMAEKLIKGKDLGEGKKESDKWVRVWSKYEEYENEQEDLIIECSYRAAFLISGIE